MTLHWPWPGDAPVVRARKIAWAYRAALEEIAPDKVAELDARFRQWGERWPAPVRHYEPHEMVTAEEAGDILALSGGAVSSLRVNGRIKGHYDKPTRRFLYRVEDLHKLSSTLRRRKPSTTDRVSDDGRSVSSEHSGAGP